MQFLTFFIENINLASSFFNNHFLFYSNYFDYNSVFLNFNWKPLSQLTFFNFESFFFYNQFNFQSNNFELFSNFNNLENLTTLYHYSIPTTKLFYPEPFIASASFMHSDLWFVHILIYQYWLWFVFIFIIIFFFITFICTVRWCNLRVRPRRETRGVSRSKCGDLITACVPVSWATSIIISESTDAIDYYDGFGTTELVVGVRAYQWGWEYYYPKDIDLHYNIKNNYSLFIGNSLKYNTANSLFFKNNNLWKFYQNKNTDQVITPAYLFLLSLDNFKIFNYLNFNDVGLNTLNESNVFKRIKNFSKFFQPNFNFNFLEYTHFYNSTSNTYFKTPMYYFSTYFGSKKQHNFLVNQNSYNYLYLNFKSVKKLLNFNFNFNNNVQPRLSPLFFFIFENFYFNKNILNFKNSIIFNKTFTFFNNNSEKNFLNKILFKTNFITNKKLFNNINFFNNYFLFYNTFNKRNFFHNLSYLNRNIENFSSNQSVVTNSKFIKKFINYPFLKNNVNLNNNLNFSENFFFFFNKNNSSFLNLYNSLKFNNINFILLNKLGSNKIYLDYPHSPIVSNKIQYNSINYDNCKNTLIPNIPSMFQSKEDLFPAYLYNIYWNFYWMHTSINHKFKNYFSSLNYFSSFYFSFFNVNYDYDFKNWQAIELLEDNIWESFLNLYYTEEFQNLNNFFYNNFFYNKINNFFSLFDKLATEKDLINENENFYNDYFYIPYTDEFYINLRFLNLNSYFTYPLINNINFIEDSYEFFKYFNFLFKIFNKSYQTFNSNFFFSISHLQYFNTVRANFEEFNWFKTFKSDINFYENKELNFQENNFFLNFRFTNYYNVRNTVKSSIVNFNALQKVFKTRLDENRSNAKLEDFNKIFLENTKQPFITSTRPHFEKLIGKTHQFFYKLNFYKVLPYTFFSSSNSLSNSLNFYFFDFPFLLSYKSDSSRYLWIDWFAKWGFYEVQPSSSSKYSLHGMPYFNKFFEFTYDQLENLNETETYFTRISKARKNYINNWNYTPFFYWKNLNWFLNSSVNTSNKLTNLNYNLSSYFWYWNKSFFKTNLQFASSTSGINSFSKTSWRSNSSISSYFLTTATLNDYVTKKEYFYRKLLFNSNKINNLPFFLINSPNNVLLLEIKNLFNYCDPIKINNSFSKNIYFNSLNSFNYYYLFNFFNDYNFLKFNFFYKKIFNYFYEQPLITNNNFLLKNTSRPLKKGINNMIRLHGTGAIAMPIEIRLQVLASSKDVIHSWAIPSAGIKIDCVPGYSSHKVMIFLVSGIFWGQCMEICGRYHHWMPIIVYFMKRDLFFLWCTHFVFLSGSNNLWSINDRQFTDSIKTVSFDKSTWIKEIIK